jgi:hypothetical protein
MATPGMISSGDATQKSDKRLVVMKNCISRLKKALISQENFICLFLIVYQFTMLFPYLQLPPFWDGINFLNYAFLTPFNHYDLAFANYGHPPLFFWLFGSLFALFGYSNLVAHSVLFIFGAIIVVSFFKISRMLVDTQTAIITSAFLVFSPLFLATVINPNLDIAVLAFLMPSYYFFLKKKYFIYAIFGTCTVMSKESGILWICAIWLTFMIFLTMPYFNRSRYERDLKKILPALFLVSVPLVILGGWMVLNKRIFGWYILPRKSPFLSDLNLFHSSFLRSLTQLFIINFTWILLLILIIFITTTMVRVGRYDLKSVLKEARQYLWGWMQEEKVISVLPILFLFLAYLLVVAPIYDFKPVRYGILVYPFLLLISVVAIQKVLKKELVWTFSLIFIGLLFIQNFYSIDMLSNRFSPPNADTGSELEYNTEFTTYVSLEISGFDYLQKNLSGRKIIFDWWNPLVVIEASHFNEKNESFGYHADPSWEYVWRWDFFNQPDIHENDQYVYLTHKINEGHYAMEERCNLTEEFYREAYGKELWIYGIQNCQGS